MTRTTELLAISTTVLVFTVAYGAYFIDGRFTALLIPPFLVYILREDFLPAAIVEKLRNPTMMNKVSFAILGAYLGFKLATLDLSGGGDTENSEL